MNTTPNTDPTPAWAYEAAEWICNLDGIRPHIEHDGSGNPLLNYMIGHCARIIASCARRSDEKGPVTR